MRSLAARAPPHHTRVARGRGWCSLATYVLAPVPSFLKNELDEYIEYRTSTFAARRQGGAVQSISAEHDKTCVLRFFGYLSRTNRVPDGELLYLSLLIRADLGSLVQGYAEWLQSTQRCKFSSIANYLNGLVSVTSYCYANLEPSDAVFNSDPNPLAQIINLRGQAEKASKTQNLYDKRSGGWCEWEDVQKARVASLAKLASVQASGTPAEKRFALRDAAAISLLSLIPPEYIRAATHELSLHLGLHLLTRTPCRLRAHMRQPRRLHSQTAPRAHAQAEADRRLVPRPLEATRRPQDEPLLRPLRGLAARRAHAHPRLVLRRTRARRAGRGRPLPLPPAAVGVRPLARAVRVDWLGPPPLQAPPRRRNRPQDAPLGACAPPSWPCSSPRPLPCALHEAASPPNLCFRDRPSSPGCATRRPRRMCSSRRLTR